MYNWSSNTILSRPIPNTKDETIIGKYKETIDYLIKGGFKPRFNILDNIASKAIVTYLKEECKIGIQLVKPHNHCEQMLRSEPSAHSRVISLQGYAHATATFLSFCGLN